MSKSLTFIINPASRFGKTKKRIGQIVREVRRQAVDANIKLTRHSLHATNLTKEALLNGAERIIAIGGDGTLNEVVNGFFDNAGFSYNKEASLGIIPSGTGSDFIKGIAQSEDLSVQVNRAIHGQAQRTDVGLVRAHNAHGEEITRYFINVSSLGLSGLTLGFMEEVTKNLGPKVAYFMASAKAVKNFIPLTIKMVDENGTENIIERCSLIGFANGKYFGSGMKLAPNAKLDDGLLDVITVSDLGLRFFLLNGYRVYQGTHLHLSNVTHTHVRECSVTALNGESVYVEVDGELFAELPAKFSIKPKAINIVR